LCIRDSSHVVHEIDKTIFTLPATTNGYASPTIPIVTRYVGVVAPANHISPSPV